MTKRITRFSQPEPPQLINGDANKKVAEIGNALPKGSLSLAFLDPHGLHLHFDTVKRLAVHVVDLIIFFPDHLDALRNWEIYDEKPNSNLDRVLGAPWRDEFKSAAPDRRAEVLTRIYRRQLETLGYSQFEFERISLPSGRFLYKLIFCSRDAAGGKIGAESHPKRRTGRRIFPSAPDFHMRSRPLSYYFHISVSCGSAPE